MPALGETMDEAAKQRLRESAKAKAAIEMRRLEAREFVAKMGLPLLRATVDAVVRMRRDGVDEREIRNTIAGQRGIP